MRKREREREKEREKEREAIKDANAAQRASDGSRDPISQGKDFPS